MRKLLAVALLVGCGSPSNGPDAGGGDDTVTLATPVKKQIFLEMVNSAEQSELDWTQAYPYCEDIDDGRGYTTGIVGFTTDSAGATTDDGPGVLGVVLDYDARWQAAR